jgi:thymidylate kinase
VGAAVAAWNTLVTDSNIASATGTTITTDKNSASTAAYTGGGTLMTCFKVSAINETAGSDAGLVIEEVIVGNVGI